jgi:hypothetical protein
MLPLAVTTTLGVSDAGENLTLFPFHGAANISVLVPPRVLFL